MMIPCLVPMTGSERNLGEAYQKRSVCGVTLAWDRDFDGNAGGIELEIGMFPRQENGPKGSNNIIRMVFCVGFPAYSRCSLRRAVHRGHWNDNT